LILRNQPTSDKDVIRFQQEELGAATGDTLVADISAFPSPNGQTWEYPNWTDVDWLQSRQACFDKWRSIRETAFREGINKHNPDVVVFCGTTPELGMNLIPTWERIAEGKFDQGVPGEKVFLFRRTEDTLFVVMRHPVARNLPTGYFERVAHFIAEHRPKA
jgi:hypothetical protein